MLLHTISAGDRWTAREKFLEYRRAVRERHNAEDEMIMLGYRAISQGRQVIDLHRTIIQAGVDLRRRPRLAIARADGVRCWYRCTSRVPTFDSVDGRDWHRRSATRITLPLESLPDPMDWKCWALLPSIPPSLRPRHRLKNYHILWEAKWEGAPIDPALLKHISGPLYAVLATWDLTELERAVLELRATN